MSETAASWVSRDFEGHRIALSAAIAKIFVSRISGGVSADDDRSGGAELRRSEALLAAVRQKPGCKCNKSDDHQKNGRICEGVERLRQLLHWPDLPFVLNQSTPPDLHCKEVEIPRFAGDDGAAHPGDTLLEAVLLGERPTAH